MDRYSINYKTLSQPKMYRLAEVRDKIKKVGFDVVKFTDTDGVEGLWQIQSDQDGSEYIVAMYAEEAPKTATASVWQFVPFQGAVQIFYKNFPIKKIALTELGVKNGDEPLVCRALSEKLTDKAGVTKLLGELSTSERQVITTKFPELG